MAGMAGMAGMAERQKEWQNGRMAEVATYILFMVHANDDDDDDTLIFYITDYLTTTFDPSLHDEGTKVRCNEECKGCT